jgi:hypothetical protein
MGAIGDVRCLEDLLHVRLGLQAHVLLAKRSCLLLDVGMLLLSLSADAPSSDTSDAAIARTAYKLLRQRHFLEWHAVHACGGAANRGREDHRRLHSGG